MVSKYSLAATTHRMIRLPPIRRQKPIYGSHVVLVTNGETVPEDTINKTASIAAFYSKGKDSGKTAVDYTYIKYVKRMPNSTPGHVIFTHHKTIMAEPKEFK